MLRHLRPQYASSFHCLGSECEDTCCHGWDIVVDKPAYEKYNSLPDLQPHMDQNFVILSNPPSDSLYARIKLTSACDCPFLSADHLCSIQQKHGEFYLANVCASYPRVTRKIDGLRETALLLSCPEAARIVLLNPDLLPPDETSANKLPRYHRFLQMDEETAGINSSPHRYLWDIREFTLLLLRDRTYPLWQRLFILGLFSHRLNEITTTQQLGLIPKLLRIYAEMITRGSLRSGMTSMPVRTALHLKVILEILERQLATIEANQERFRDCVQDFLRGIHYSAGASFESFVPFYEEAGARYYEPFMQQHPYILENYLLNYVFRTRFPYGVDPQGNDNDPLTEYMVMCVPFATIKDLLIGTAGHYREAFGAAHVVKLVQSFAKAVEQSPKFRSTDYRSFGTADGLALLLNNENL